jgi:putative ABC transport system permease protein
MMGYLVVRNLFHRPGRTLIGVIAVAVEVMLVIVIVGLTSGMLEETAKRIEGIGADIMLQSPSAQIFLAFSGSPMPIKIADKLREMKYVKAVAPALLQFNSSGSIDILYGIDKESFREVSGGLVFLQGHDMEGPDDLLVDDWAAKAKNLKVGDTYTLLNHKWNVVGIVERN